MLAGVCSAQGGLCSVQCAVWCILVEASSMKSEVCRPKYAVWCKLAEERRAVCLIAQCGAFSGLAHQHCEVQSKFIHNEAQSTLEFAVQSALSTVYYST